MTSFRSLPLAVAAICAAAWSSPASAQTRMSTGDGLLSVSAQMPDEVRVGEEFTYTVDVSNASDNVTLHNVKLAQRKSQGITVESVSMKGQNSGQSGSQSSSGQQSGQSSNNQDQNNQGNSGGESDSGGKQLTIDSLKPGDSRTFEVKAVADEQGEIRSCLEVVSYQPAMCLISQAVKPQLELTKTAPKKANRCNVIKLEYTLKNGGSGDVGAIVITDSLGKGLATIDGENELKFNVDELTAGDTRKFVARVYASETGTFSSRATAKAQNSDLKSRSKQTDTKVISADLSAKLDGPSRIYGDSLAQFTAEVTNDGNVVAEDVRINVMWPDAVNLADMGQPQMVKSGNSQSDSSGSQNSSGSQGSSGGQPTMAVSSQGGNNSSEQDESNDDSGSQGSGSDSQTSEMQMAEETITIDQLQPGQTARFEYAIRTGDLDELPTKIVATSVCTVEPAEGEAKATSRASATAMTTAKVVRLPALQLVVFDDEDPVRKGSEVVYTIRVWNEGDATDNNVQLTAQLPDNLKFVSGDGPTDVKGKGQDIEFGAIKTMEPGDEVTYKVTAKGEGDGAVSLKTQLASKSLKSKIVAEEPTRIFSR